MEAAAFLLSKTKMNIFYVFSLTSDKARIQESYSHPDNQDLLKAREYFTELKNRLEG